MESGQTWPKKWWKYVWPVRKTCKDLQRWTWRSRWKSIHTEAWIEIRKCHMGEKTPIWSASCACNMYSPDGSCSQISEASRGISILWLNFKSRPVQLPHICDEYVYISCMEVFPWVWKYIQVRVKRSFTEAMTFLKNVLPTNALYGKGFSGPEICITNNSDAERAALGNIWPGTTFLLCILHHLQRW